jgi:hypothetical protein
MYLSGIVHWRQLDSPAFVNLFLGASVQQASNSRWELWMTILLVSLRSVQLQVFEGTAEHAQAVHSD